MAFGAKTNERPGTRAELKFARFSAYKAREVLNLIRGLPVGEAAAILQLTERGASEPILKLLNSAIANAVNNDGIPADELFVSACFADEGPTLKRFRPRARGRAGKIRKRTTHITIIVSRLDGESLEILRAKASRSGRAGNASASRARRVAQSRQAAPVEEPTTEEPTTEVTETEAEAVETEVIETEVTDNETEATEAEVTEEAADDAADEGDK